MAVEGNNNGQAIDIDRWVDSMERMLEEVPHYMCTPGHPGRISRIPESLREVAVKAYEPYQISIGPYHHGKPEVQRMEKRKCEALKCVLEMKPELALKDYLIELKSIESSARSFYSDIQMESEEFVRMLLLDSMCIVTAFCGLPREHERRNHTNGGVVSRENGDSNERVNQINEDLWNLDADENTPIMSGIQEMRIEASSINDRVDKPRWFWFWFAHDIFLLENQLPFFVLQKIHDLVYGGCGTQLIVTLKKEFCNMLLDYTRIDSEMVVEPNEDVHHLLHLCHIFFRPTVRHEFTACDLSQSSQMFRLGNAVQLYEAGVKFEAASSSTQYSLLDISLSSFGKMIMPCLYVEDNTESLLRNLIALEQMKYPSLGLNVSAYAVLLLHLITIPEDVSLLRKKGIIQHHLSSDKEMVRFINRLSVGLAFDYVDDNYSLKDVFQGLKSYSERRVPRWRAWLKPCVTIFLLVACLFLICTVLQTFYQMYSYYRPFIDSQP